MFLRDSLQSTNIKVRQQLGVLALLCIPVKGPSQF